PAPPPPPPVAAPPALVEPPASPPPPRSRPSPQRVAGYTLGAIGLAGLGAGAILGGLTIAKQHSAACNVGGVKYACSPPGFQTIEAARSLGNGSTAAIVAGGVLAATGVILVLTDRRSQHKPNTGGAPWVGAGLLAAGATGPLVGARGGF